MHASDLHDRDLDDIQGNVLVGFKKDWQTFVVLRLPDDTPELAKAWLAGIVNDVATTRQARDFNKLFREIHMSRETHERLGARSGSAGQRLPPPVTATWMNVAFTASGLRRLGVPESNLELFPVFNAGMRARAEEIGDTGDSGPENWLEPFQGEFDALMIVAADVERSMNDLLTQLMLHGRQHRVEDVFKQRARMLDAGVTRGRDHFGFKDGISQPVVALPGDSVAGSDAIAVGEFVLGHRQEHESAATAGACSSPPWKNGSFLVLRRLRQEVAGFNEFVDTTAPQVGISADLLRAKMLGRYPSGAPLVGAERAAEDPYTGGDVETNSFDYRADLEGVIVPRAAHIRNANARDEESRRRRIIRRGIPYGDQLQPNAERGTPYAADADRGLCFVCYQRSIEDQFEYIQRQANDVHRPRADDGADPIAAQAEEGERFFRLPGSAVERFSLGRPPWVTTTGGGYFFAPSITTLELLAASG